jgi:hypothetical protein
MAAFSIEWADNTRDPVGSKRSSRFVRAKMSTGFGLRARVVALIVMVAAPLIALLLFETSEERGVALDHAHARVADLARVSAAQEDNDLQDARTLVLVLGRVAEIREALAPGADAGRCHALLRKVVQDHPQVAAITVTGPGGWAACGSHTPKPDVDFSDRDWFIAAIAPDAAPVVASRVIMSRQLGRPTVVVASRTPAANAGEPALGVVSASLDLGWLSSLASQYPQDGPAIAGIIDPGTGAVLAHSKGRTDDLGQISTDPALLDAIRSHPEGGSVETTVAGKSSASPHCPAAQPAARSSMSACSGTLCWPQPTGAPSDPWASPQAGCWPLSSSGACWQAACCCGRSACWPMPRAAWARAGWTSRRRWRAWGRPSSATWARH